jgi:pyruvate dehydrogenase E2 component (dihydrolipoamide acetyltransferase)
MPIRHGTALGNSPGGRQIASPRARRAITALGVDVARIHGSGPGGRIVEADVLAARPAPAQAPAGTTLVPLGPMRLAIARRTAESFATIPHFYLRAELDATALVDLRAQLLDDVQRDYGVRLTLTDFLLGAMARAMADCPWANRIWRDQALVEFPTVDLALQVAVDDGLLAPVIRRADTLGLPGMAKERSRLVGAARSGRLSADAMGGAAASLSNLGEGRVDEFGAVIMPPQSSILAVGRAAPRPFVVRNALAVRTTLRLCLSVDHRVMDGAAGGKFLGRIVEILENPAMLLWLAMRRA